MGPQVYPLSKKLRGFVLADHVDIDLELLHTLKAESEIAPELTGHGLPLSECEAYNRVYEQPYESR